MTAELNIFQCSDSAVCTSPKRWPVWSLLMLLFLLAFYSHSSLAQGRSPEIGTYQKVIISGSSLQVGWDKTTVLIFPFEIMSVDRGSKALMAQKDAVAHNVLKLKAGQRHFPGTNLHVMTADGAIFYFEVSYHDTPAETSINIQEGDRVSFQRLAKGFPKSHEIEAVAEALKSERPFMRKKHKHLGLKLMLRSIYAQDGLMYFRMQLKNRSNIPFDPILDISRVQDKKLAKRTSVREIEKTPVKVFHEKDADGLKGPMELVLVYPEFTIADDKYLHIGFAESMGDRNIALKIKGKQLLKARKPANVQLNIH
ncbi:Conjugative transposon protein TraN [Indibacter alkaliphilus LW1]|uniref:Conjugative transposon protein TraN n=1 Tax=Indibacter alkaliphilus (strain CCUG 57479 / KCTC 22604 / LW1) TaxID=1189612 RepID=S2DIR1_INDAL|nr:conjugative transposon protein TraN [Indibacter alkaliphilus]EOZ98934.1 Conjugative transposon protein TraN [Indibacter alkaliphilus LW1]